ncbi:hypothetical protein FSP39_007022 [Pinctada imbricata]|uniref:D-aminoacyl-tRNA deacylase n=1 Tax=Pinctada imbricata TaxID=66713 RepID=A0AA88XVR9_PINIB|nr:hypothetical protein FSP39_007022 [Pinctada imbricata]
MKAIVQRVLQSSVTVDGKVVSSIGQGLCVLVGITQHDSPRELDWMVRKILNLRVFEDDAEKKWNKSVMDKQYEILCVSQFTLAVTMKGNKPDFHEAMNPELSQPFYREFLKQLGENYSPEKIKDGEFGAYMQVHIQNDGPVTIPLETPDSLKDDPKLNKKYNNPKKTLNPGAKGGAGSKSVTGKKEVPGSTGLEPKDSPQLLPSDLQQVLRRPQRML